MLVQGPQVALFEARVAQQCRRAYAVAVANGTSALYLALKALGVGPGQSVLCPDLTWPSPAHVIVECGAQPILVDVDGREWNASPAGLAAARTPETSAAIVIDQFGNPARALEIMQALPGLPLIVDAACSLGSRIGSAPCGSFGTIACISFHPRKVITTGEGGMCLTDDALLAERLQELRNHGQSLNGIFKCASGNFRMSEIAAAIGLAQMSRLDAILEARREQAQRYQAALPYLGLQLQQSCNEAIPNYQTFGVLLPKGTNSEKRNQIIAQLRKAAVESTRLSYALHLLPSLARFGPVRGEAASDSPGAISVDIAERGIALPLHPQLTAAEQDNVIAALLKVLQLAR